MSDHLRLKPNKLRRFALERAVTLAVVTGGSLVLLAIASIFLFLVWQSAPLWLDKTVLQSAKHLTDTRFEAPAPLSDRRLLVRETATQRNGILSFSPTESLATWRPLANEVAMISTAAGDSEISLVVQEDCTISVYEGVDWGAAALKETPSPLWRTLCDELPATAKIERVAEGRYQIVLRYASELHWLEAVREQTPLRASLEMSIQPLLVINSESSYDQHAILAEGRWLLEWHQQGAYVLHSADGTRAIAGQIDSLLPDTHLVRLGSSYGLVGISEQSEWIYYGLDQHGEAPILALLDKQKLAFNGQVMAMGPVARGVAVVNNAGMLSFYDPYTRGTERIQLELTADHPRFALNGMITLLYDQSVELWRVEKHSATIPLATLFGRLTYESYAEPSYTWQSTGISPLSSPKFSITPLLYGTFKAAFYTLLFAAPMAIAAAVFTAYFMTASVRAAVKPSLELLAALPTVILGLVAGLWLAPWLEHHLLHVAFAIALIPLCLVAMSFIWRLSPGGYSESQLSGSELILTMLAVGGGIWLASFIGSYVESVVFPTGLVSALSERWGISYEQRNSIVVGVMMGLAVFPTIYTIAEDALFAVPSHLREGALAMGATEWQTARSIVLPTAAPGILSAVMMGLARAIGETMIVLMATGNTPIIDGLMTTGMRTIAATLAIEMPEVVPQTLHFHVLIFLALQLFVFTFLINTLADVVRRRLRQRLEHL